MPAIKLLVIDDETNLRLVIQKEMRRLGYEVETAEDGETAWEMLETQDFDVLLCDINMPRLSGVELLRRLRERRQNPPEAIMLTGQATVETAIESMKLGAYDYLTKPYRITEIAALVKKAGEKRNLRTDNQRLRAQIQRKTSTPEIISESPQMRETLRLVEKVAPSDACVLVTGESGTGKELIAQMIHKLSPRANASFVDLNCAALQDTLLESELFGHEAGAFSGAKNRKLGLFELADGGTLFLDEIMEMPTALQSKLLRALETKSFYRVGGTRKVEINVRIVAATNRNPEEAVESGVFRADLLYRVNSFEINLAPLRERQADIEPLTRYWLENLSSNQMEIAPEAISALKNHAWRGNIRQLRNVLERAVLLADNNKIELKDLPPEIARNQHHHSEQPQTKIDSANFAAGNFVYNNNNNNSPTALHEVERQQIISALEKTNWHRGKTAEILGISSSTLYRRLREYNLEA
ncbi:MAG: sigma-54-dependent Fis family transcriptional regulator [Pyrinomonadaceae bacterium]|nr:sigma-54-dependent Fis family transcriptional regulator [Pyrinomonadaceae bacterium]